MKSYFQTDIGMMRTSNEDNVTILKREDALLAIVADGMGGHNAGEIASKLVIEHFEVAWNQLPNDITAVAAEEWLQKEIEVANGLVFQYATDNEDCSGMGTTIVAAICTSKFATIAHIGDSRCYLHNQSGFHQITEDHSYVNYLVKAGGISKEDAEQHPRKNVLTRALGTNESVDIDVKTVLLEVNDKMLICSDGLYSQIEADEIEKIVQQDKPLAELAEVLIEMAKANGGDDNISIVLLQQSTSFVEGA